jgi:hypothetical protein
MEKVTGGVEMRVDGGRVDRNTLFPVATLTGKIGSPLLDTLYNSEIAITQVSRTRFRRFVLMCRVLKNQRV